MARMGHDDMRAALIYQRATQEAAERIAQGLSELAKDHRKSEGDRGDPDEEDGAAAGLVPTGGGHVEGHEGDWSSRTRKPRPGRMWRLAWAFVCGADDGNRTRVLSLGS